MISFHCTFYRDPDLHEVPSLLNPKTHLKKVANDRDGEEEKPDSSARTTLKQDPGNQPGVKLKNKTLEEAENKRIACKATKVESVPVISLIKSNKRTSASVESDPIEVKLAKPEPSVAATKNKELPTVEPQNEPVEIERQDLQTDAISNSIQIMKTGESSKENEERSLDEYGEGLIPIEIPKIISWEALGLEPLQLNKIRIGPLTESNKWSEKRASKQEPEHAAHKTETQCKVAGKVSGRNKETIQKVTISLLFSMGKQC